MSARIKKNDTVCVITGKDKGQRGLVLDVLSREKKLLVKGVAIVTKHSKARRRDEVSEIKKQESYIALSNVMVVCKSCKKPSRMNAICLESGERARVCNRCKEII